MRWGKHGHTGALDPAPNLLDEQRAFNLRKEKIGKLPNNVFIELAMACNLRCEMCPVPKNMELMGGRARAVMKPDVFRRVLAQLSGRRYSLCLNQLGEPLLNKHVVDYVKWAKADGHHVGFYTNGTLLNQLLADRLLDAGLDYIVFSIDGATKETFERIRLGAKFEPTIKNIRYFCEAAKARKSACGVQVHMIVSDLTEHEKEAFQEFWRGYAETRLIPLDDWAGQLKLPEKFGRPRTSKSKGERYPCDLLWTALYISAEGNVLYCCHDYKKESGLPSIMEEDLLKIWDTHMSEERKKHLTKRYVSAPCRDCNAWQTRPEKY